MGDQGAQAGDVGFQRGEGVFQHLGPGGVQAGLGVMGGELDDGGQDVLIVGGEVRVVGGGEDELHHRGFGDFAVFHRVEGALHRVHRGGDHEAGLQVAEVGRGFQGQMSAWRRPRGERMNWVRL